MTATLRLVREGVGVELRRGSFQVLVDGADSGSIEWHGTFETTVAPGRHTLQVRKGRYRCPAHTFQADEGEIVTFRCHGVFLWPFLVASFVKPDIGIKLIRQ